MAGGSWQVAEAGGADGRASTGGPGAKGLDWAPSSHYHVQNKETSRLLPAQGSLYAEGQQMEMERSAHLQAETSKTFKRNG